MPNYAITRPNNTPVKVPLCAAPRYVLDGLASYGFHILYLGIIQLCLFVAVLYGDVPQLYTNAFVIICFVFCGYALLLRERAKRRRAFMDMSARLESFNTAKIPLSSRGVPLYKEYTNTGQFDVALPMIMEAIQHGDHDALCYLGCLYFEGFGVPKDIEKAFTCITESAQMGSANALMLLGTAHRKGEFLPEDLHKAREYFIEAVKQGQPAALKDLDSLLTQMGIGNTTLH